ncbi:MAG TPA: VOC family protein [bacterium]|nr:VOC family protein [bacterium]
MPEIKKAYVTIMVADLDRSVDFYTNVVGLYEDLRFGDNWAEMVTQGITIGLHPEKQGTKPDIAAKMGWGALTPGQQGPSEAGAAPSSAAKAGHDPSHAQPPSHHIQLSIGFEVKDIRATAKEMEAKGVRFHFQENEVNILAFFKDPDGTPLYLTQVR